MRLATAAFILVACVGCPAPSPAQVPADTGLANHKFWSRPFTQEEITRLLDALARAKPGTVVCVDRFGRLATVRDVEKHKAAKARGEAPADLSVPFIEYESPAGNDRPTHKDVVPKVLMLLDAEAAKLPKK